MVHLDNLKGPPKEKQIIQRDDAKDPSSAAIGQDAELHPNGTSEHQEKDDDAPMPESLDEDLPPPVVEPPTESLPPHLRATLQAPREKPEQVATAPLCRTKQRIRMRETPDGLVVVDPEDEAVRPDETVVAGSHEGQKKDAGVSEQPLPSPEDDVVGPSDSIENGASKQARQEPSSSSAAEWQAYANVPNVPHVPRGFKVSTEAAHHVEILIDSV